MQFARRLLEVGRNPRKPIAFIEKGITPEERFVNIKER
jgi:siroheme synthase